MQDPSPQALRPAVYAKLQDGVLFAAHDPDCYQSGLDRGFDVSAYQPCVLLADAEQARLDAHEAGVQAMADALRQVLDGTPCLASAPPELAEVARRIAAAAASPADSSLMNVVEQILDAGHLNTEDLARLRAAWEASASSEPDWRPDSPNLWRTAEQPEAAPALKWDEELTDEQIDRALSGFHAGPWLMRLSHDELRELARRLVTASSADARDAALATVAAERDALLAKLNTPELHDFAAGVVLEAAHQRERWGAEHDVGKAPADWFWLLGYLGGKVLKALEAKDLDKALHHTISSAAALANWHAAISGVNTAMRPGIDPVVRGFEDAAIADENGCAA